MIAKKDHPWIVIDSKKKAYVCQRCDGALIVDKWRGTADQMLKECLILSKNMRIAKMHPIKWDDIAFDMVTPCAECPFRKETPVRLMGAPDDYCHTYEELFNGHDNKALHSCHKTDPRVTDGGFVEGYEGKIQHCGGLMLTALKWNAPTYYMVSAMFEGKLSIKTIRKLRKQFDLVPTIVELKDKILRYIVDEAFYAKFHSPRQTKSEDVTDVRFARLFQPNDTKSP